MFATAALFHIPDEVWVCLGEQNAGRIIVANCADGLARDLGMQVGGNQMLYDKKDRWDSGKRRSPTNSFGGI